MRLILLATSPRVAPGLLSWPAWAALRAADRVLAGSAEHPLLPYLDEAGIGYRVVPAEPGPVLAAAGPGTTVWVGSPDGDEELLRGLGARVVDGGEQVELEVLPGSYDLPGARLLDLVATMDRLRVECPWDARQTHESLAPHLLEEAYEAVEAVETGDPHALREELGDVLLQVAFHARVAQERAGDTGYDIDDVAAGIVDKLVRRHPHVFASTRVSGAEEVKANWDAIKAAERAARSGAGEVSVLDGVPFGQPALALAAALHRRARRAGVPEELAADAEPGLGAELFAAAVRADAAGLDPEAELRAAARRYRDRVRAHESARRPAG